VDEELLEEFAADEARALGATVDVRWVSALDGLLDAAQAAREDGVPLIVVTAPGTAQLAALPPEVAPWTVRVDLTLCEPDTSVGLLTHIQGRGIDGVRWALRTVCHRARRPIERVHYGQHPDQFGDLRLPDGPAATGVVVLLHGGFWRSRWQLDLMDALSVDVAERGLASWNVEYRPPDRHGWAATVADVRAAVDHVRELSARFPVDVDRVALVGHSAGGQLAVQVSADGGAVRPTLVVQLAGLVDLLETHRRDLGNGAVPSALGGTPEQIADVYAQASPLQRVPIGVRQLVVVGRSDSPDLREMSRRYVRAAAAGGDDVELIEDEGDHFTVIDPGSRIWQRTVEAVAATLGS
jgi:acetyl esterase/lipase